MEGATGPVSGETPKFESGCDVTMIELSSTFDRLTVLVGLAGRRFAA
jgi:hypothetical protein